MTPSPRPKKIFGQNFLSDPAILSRIVQEGEIAPGERVLEVGPGRGALTREILARGGEVVAVEIDRELVSHLRAIFAGTPAVTLVEGDILSIPIPTLCPDHDGRGWKVVANLPYNISTPFLFRLVEHRGRFSRIVVMLQREVGERLAATPGSDAYGALSVIFQSRFNVRRAFVVKPGSFFPRPKVDSVVVVITTRTDELDVGDHGFFTRLVKGVFSARRKTLLNALKGLFPISDHHLLTMLGVLDIDPVRRGETLGLDDFARLSREVSRYLENA